MRSYKASLLFADVVPVEHLSGRIVDEVVTTDLDAIPEQLLRHARLPLLVVGCNNATPTSRPVRGQNDSKSGFCILRPTNKTSSRSIILNQMHIQVDVRTTSVFANQLNVLSDMSDPSLRRTRSDDVESYAV